MPKTPEERRLANNLKQALYAKRHPEKVKARLDKWKAENPDSVRAHARKNHATHREERLAQRAEWRKTHPEELRAQRAADHAKHRDERLIKMQAYYEANKEWMLPEMREYRLAHLEEKRAYLEKYYIEHREELSIKHAEYARAHPEVASAHQRAHRAAKRNAPINDLTHAQWGEIQSAQDHCCAHCKKRCKNKLTQDHILALDNGGSHTLHNVIGVCRSCNSKKGTRPSPVLVQPLLLTIAPSKKKKAA